MSQVLRPTKGQKLNIEKKLNEGNPLSKVLVGLGWTAPKGAKHNYDLDASLLTISNSGERVLCYYGEQSILEGTVQSNGDNQSGEGEGDDEQITIDLENLPSDIKKMVVFVNIHNGDSNNQTFGQVSDAFIRLEDNVNGKELGRFDLDLDACDGTGVVFATLLKSSSGSWVIQFDQEELNVNNATQIVTKYR